MSYRINGFEQIKAFYSWVFNNPDKARPTHISLYLFLLNQANRSNWAEWFKCPYDLAMQGACIGNNGTYYKCLEELKEWKLIDYQKGLNNYKAPLIHLFCLYEYEQLTEQVTVPLSEQVTEQQTVQLTEQVNEHIYKVLTNNIKRITDNLSEIIDFLDEKEKEDNEDKISFDVFWNLYNKKVGAKAKCEKKWNKLPLSTQQKIIDTLPSFKAKVKNIQFLPFPETYLNQERWNDEDVTVHKDEIDPNSITALYAPRKVNTGREEVPGWEYR